ncbi:MBL fold metallo-hydrolase [Halocynthiibacter sp. C4]|uniref:MBL fold metallo-hydrolase n=1 Tax=Halocynthiibacter sp. C4 TaxID=2992758 RepID=UPI00237BA864|nr:MBL fold metallo-hydrolase [Halocynthiibacter sp. C4]MDE0589368.1 MBL fold metallo-hydrolase [Halocynthiibacter sp. C4]
MTTAPKDIAVLTKPPQAGQITDLADGLRVLLAPNPSPMTYWGTNTYFIGTDNIAIIDPGPDNPDHLKAILEAVGTSEVSAILVTHSHLDHSPLARQLSLACGAPIYAFGKSTDGRTPQMNALAATGDIEGGEGVDTDFAPDQRLADGQTLKVGSHTLTAIHTPGHFCNHLCFRWGDLLFSGDHIMGWASTLISPPDGDLSQYRASLDKLLGTGAEYLLPGHGPAVSEPDSVIQALRKHRNDRESQILAALTDEPQSLSAITHKIYTDIPKALLPAASRNTLAHLIDLNNKNIARVSGPLGTRGQYSLITKS